MKPDTIKNLAKMYREKIESLGFSKPQKHPARNRPLAVSDTPRVLRREYETLAVIPEQIDSKGYYWAIYSLGKVQGLLLAYGIYTIEQIGEHNSDL